MPTAPVSSVRSRRVRLGLLGAIALAGGAAMAPTASATTCAVGTYLPTYDVCEVQYTNPAASNTFTAPPAVVSVDLLLVGGGGGGGGGGPQATGVAGGGGAGGQVVSTFGYAVTPGAQYAVSVGAGGPGSTGTAGGPGGASGDDSFFDNSVGATGGAGGLDWTTNPDTPGLGGATSPYSWITPVPFAFTGGSGAKYVQTGCGICTVWSGAGGGAGTAGNGGNGSGALSSGQGGVGGPGILVTGPLPTGRGFPGLSPATYGGGGGGGAGASNLVAQSAGAGSGGGGNGGTGGAVGTGSNATAGAPNTGGGGGGGGVGILGVSDDAARRLGGDGANGIVVVRYVPVDPPDVPVISGTTPGVGQATISVVPGTGPGDPPTSFLITASPGGGTCTVTLPDNSCTITGLTGGTAYTFTATAINAGGTSGPSSPSAAVTPTSPPATPSNHGTAVDPTPAAVTATAGRPVAGRGAVLVPVTATGAGTAVVTGTGPGTPRAGTLLMCTGTTTFAAAGRKTVVCMPTAAAQTLRRKGAVRLRVALSFAAKGGPTTRTVVGRVVLSRVGRHAVPVTG